MGLRVSFSCSVRAPIPGQSRCRGDSPRHKGDAAQGGEGVDLDQAGFFTGDETGGGGNRADTQVRPYGNTLQRVWGEGLAIQMQFQQAVAPGGPFLEILERLTQRALVAGAALAEHLLHLGVILLDQRYGHGQFSPGGWLTIVLNNETLAHKVLEKPGEGFKFWFTDYYYGARLALSHFIPHPRPFPRRGRESPLLSGEG